MGGIAVFGFFEVMKDRACGDDRFSEVFDAETF
jgi:hypothetical protein